VIPQQIIDEATQHKTDCTSYVNDEKWMANAADYFKDCAVRDSQRSVEDLAKDKWSYLEYRANMHVRDAFGTIHYGDKPAREKWLKLQAETA